MILFIDESDRTVSELTNDKKDYVWLVLNQCPTDARLRHVISIWQKLLMSEVSPTVGSSKTKKTLEAFMCMTPSSRDMI
jgi:hypothetical protein